MRRWTADGPPAPDAAAQWYGDVLRAVDGWLALGEGGQTALSTREALTAAFLLSRVAELVRAEVVARGLDIPL